MEEKRFSPVTMSEALHAASIARKMVRLEAEAVYKYYLMRILEAGCDEGVRDVVDSINYRFVEEERELVKQRIDEHLRRRGIMDMQEIDADDDQIVKAILLTLRRFQSDWDWGGVYRILVDFCHFPQRKTEFVKRFAQMGIYPQDSTVKVDRLIPPVIRNDNNCGHPFSYQSIQKGVSPQWPADYQGWMNVETPDVDLENRRQIATVFYRNLVKVTEAS